MSDKTTNERLALSAWKHSSVTRSCFFGVVCRPVDRCECYRDAEARVMRREVIDDGH